MVWNKIRRLAIMLVIIVMMTAGNGTGQNIHELNQSVISNKFIVDYSYFKSDRPGFVKLEIYYRVYNIALQFIGEGNRYQARYEIAALIKDSKNKQITAFTKEKSISLYSYESTVSPNDFRISQLDKELPPGKYKIELILTDNNSGSEIKTEFKVELPEYKGGYPSFSGVEFVEKVDTAIVDSTFIKGDLSIIPSASRSFTADTSSGILYYFEIYKGDKEENEYLIETRVLNKKYSKVYADSVKIKFEDDIDVLRQIRQIGLKDFKSGEYYVELVVKGNRNRDINKIRQRFQIYWAPGQMILHDHETAIQMLKYIADPGDMKAMKKAKTSEERLRLFKDFWKSKDPTPETGVNETMQNYYRRIEYANRSFSVLNRPGWKTDFGMIYIQYGIPDQIEDFPMETNTRSYQIWYYYRYGEPLKFVFIDDFGDADYRLQYPYDGKSW